MNEMSWLMKFEAAVIQRDGKRFAVAIVRPNVLVSPYKSKKIREQMADVLPDLPIVLMSRNARGAPFYQGPSDLMAILDSSPMLDLGWEAYEVGEVA